jgi:hypothetical protein
MTVTNLATTNELLPLLSALLQNTPIPSDDTGNTLTRDYDRKRFYRQPIGGISGQEDVSAHIIFTRERTYDQLRVYLNELDMKRMASQGLRYTVSYRPMIEHVVDALVNWVSAPEREWYTAHIECKFHKYNLSQDILRFCVKHRILRYLFITLDIIGQIFSQVEKLSMEQEQDHETDEEWLMIDLTVYGEVDEILEKYNKYTDQIISSIPWPERSKIRLSYNIL